MKRFVGKPIRRNEDARLLTGQALFVDDVDLAAGGSFELLSTETFAAGIPGSWTLTGSNTGTETWHTTDKGGRYLSGVVGGHRVNRLAHPAALPEFAILDSDAVDLLRYPFRGYVLVGWNARRTQLADKRVRQALTRGTNRQEIVDALLQGYGTVANGSVPPFHWAYDPSIGRDAMSYDQDAARALLAAAGWVDRDGDGVRENAAGVRLAISIKYNHGNDMRQDIAEIMQAQLSQVGVEVTPMVVEWGTLLDQIGQTPRDFDGVVMGWIVEYKLDDTDLFHSDNISETYAWSGTQRPDIDRFLEELPLVVDREEAKPIWSEYQELLVDEQPYTFFFFDDRLDGINKRLRGVEMDARGEWLNIKDWWIPADQR